MKVQSWGMLSFITVFFGWEVHRSSSRGELAMVMLWLLLYFYCLFVCFVPEAFEAERKRTDRCRRIEEELFGSRAGLARWTGFFFYFVALALAVADPYSLYPTFLPAGCATLYQIWYWKKYLKAARKETDPQNKRL